MTETPETHRLKEEAAWVAQVLAGDIRGFEALIRRYHASLERVLRGILRNAEDAEDLHQETFLRAYRFLHRFDTRRPFGPWLMRIGANLARNHLRKRRVRQELSIDETPEAGCEEGFEGAWLADLTTVAELEYRQLRDETRRALASLPDDQRLVLEMRLLAEMSYKEMAETLSIPIGTVMSRLNRGRRQIQDRLAERLGSTQRSAYTSQASSPEVP